MVTESNMTLHLHKNPFCLIWKPQGVSFNETLDELEEILK